LPRLLTLVLVVGMLAFGVFYYQDQHVDAGPSMVGRATLAAEAAVKRSPSNITARLALADAYRLDKRLDDSLKQYAEILKADKTNRFALLGRGSVLVTKGDLTAAEVTYKKVTGAQKKGEFAGADPQLEEAYYYLGMIAVKQGKATEAITDLSAALKIDSADSDAYYQMGLAETKAGSTQLAVNAFQEALKFVPTDWCEPYDQLAVAYAKLNQKPSAAYNAGMASFCHKKPADAKRQLKALITGPVKVDAYLALALIAETESNNPEAISWYKQLLTVDRKNVAATIALKRLDVGPTGSPTTQGSS
jgi:tetratricopeptide (TPR) repeat protein